MKVSLSATAVLAVVGVGVAGFVGWRVYKAAGSAAGAVGQGLASAAQAVNPWNRDNLVARGVNAGVSAAVGREENLGGWLWDKLNPDPMDAFNSPGWSTSGGKYNNPSAYAPDTLQDLGLTDTGELYDPLGNRIY